MARKFNNKNDFIGNCNGKYGKYTRPRMHLESGSFILLHSNELFL